MIILLEIWVQVLAPVNHCQKILQDPACDVMTAGDVLKKLGQNYIQKGDEIMVQAINWATSWCEGREIPLEKWRRKRKIIAGESAKDTVLSATQNTCQIMVAVIDILVSEVTAVRHRTEVHLLDPSAVRWPG